MFKLLEQSDKYIALIDTHKRKKMEIDNANNFKILTTNVEVTVNDLQLS